MQERKPPSGHGHRGGLTARSCSPPCPRFLGLFEQHLRPFPCRYPYCMCCERLSGVRVPRGGENTASLIRGAATTQEQPIIKFQQGCSLVHPEKKPFLSLVVLLLPGHAGTWGMLIGERLLKGSGLSRAMSVSAQPPTCVTASSSGGESGSDSGCH